MTDISDQPIPQTLRICQQNLKKSPTAQSAFISSLGPGHVDIKGNEVVDRRAKEAAKATRTDNDSLPKQFTHFLASASKLRQSLQEHIKELFKGRWANSPRHDKQRRIDPSLPSPKFMKLTANLPRRSSSLLIQLRTGVVPLQSFLHKIGKTDSPLCPSCKKEKETVRHFILSCPAFNKQRESLRAELGRPAASLQTLLSNKRALKPLFKFLHQTGRFIDSFRKLQSLAKRAPYKD